MEEVVSDMCSMGHDEEGEEERKGWCVPWQAKLTEALLRAGSRQTWPSPNTKRRFNIGKFQSLQVQCLWPEILPQNSQMSDRLSQLHISVGPATQSTWSSVIPLTCTKSLAGSVSTVNNRLTCLITVGCCHYNWRSIWHRPEESIQRADFTSNSDVNARGIFYPF